MDKRTSKLILEIEQLIKDDLQTYWFYAGNRNMKRAIKAQERITRHEQILDDLKRGVIE